MATAKYHLPTREMMQQLAFFPGLTSCPLIPPFHFLLVLISFPAKLLVLSMLRSCFIQALRFPPTPSFLPYSPLQFKGHPSRKKHQLSWGGPGKPQDRMTYIGHHFLSNPATSDPLGCIDLLYGIKYSYRHYKCLCCDSHLSVLFSF